MSANKYQPTRFAAAASGLGAGVLDFWFQQYPDEQSQRLSARVKLAAKLLGKATGLPHSKALEAVAQAVRFPSWHVLSAHLVVGETAVKGQLPSAWLDALSGAVVLMLQPEDEVALPDLQLRAFEQFGQTLAMLTDEPTQKVLDGVSSVLCGAKSWTEVRDRNPLKATTPLYSFVVPEGELAADDDEFGGCFEESPACAQLAEELDEVWQGYDSFPKAKQRKARQWVEDALASQPGFLEAGLALAWMQHEAEEAEASSTVNRFIRQAEALVPKGFKGRIAWGHVGNRFYHRLLWLRLTVFHDHGELASAVKVARKQLKLNPYDNLGVRYVLPLMLLEMGEFTLAQRAAKRHLDDEVGLTASAIKAFCEFALDGQVFFRRELATALITLPWLRTFLANQSKPLPDGDDGIRAMQPDLETFMGFGWPAYCAVPGLRKACEEFLAEPQVLQAEAELRAYWKSYWRRRDGGGTGTREGWDELVNSWIDRLARRPSTAHFAAR